MKKIIIAIFTIFMLSSLCACHEYRESPNMLRDSNGDSRFIIISHVYGNTIYVDKETGVEYWWHSDNGGYQAGLTPILNKDGKPIIYQGEY